MPAIINTSRNAKNEAGIGSGVSQVSCIDLSNSAVCRPLGFTWTEVFVDFKLSLWGAPASGNLPGNPVLSWGLCAAGRPWRAANAHAYGPTSGDYPWVAQAGESTTNPPSAVFWYSTTRWPKSKVGGSVATIGTGYFVAIMPRADTLWSSTGLAANWGYPWIGCRVHVIKGSPNWTMTYSQQGWMRWNTPKAHWLGQVESNGDPYGFRDGVARSADMIFQGGAANQVAQYSAAWAAPNEAANGAIDSFYVDWSLASPIVSVRDIHVTRWR